MSTTTAPTPAPPAPAPAPSFQPTLPSGVRERAANADEMIRRMQKGESPFPPAATAPQEPPTTPDAPPQEPPQPSQEPPAPQAPPQPSQAPPQPSQAPPKPAPAPAPEGDTALAARVTQAEQEARTWRGRFEAAERDRRAVAGEIGDLRAEMAALRATPAAPAATPASTGLSAEEIENFGPDLMDAVARHSRATLEPIIQAEVERRLAGVRTDLDAVRGTANRTQQTAQQLADQRFLSGMDADLPNWRTVDTDPGFLSWVGEYDPLIGRTRKESLDGAVSDRDNGRVIAFFRAFLDQQSAGASRGAGNGTRAGAAAPGGSPAAGSEQDAPPSLADLAAPGKARNAAPPATGGPRVWTMTEIREHTHKIARGLYRDAAEQDRISREIATAQREGRVNLQA